MRAGVVKDGRMDMARTKSDWCGASRPGRAACYAHSWSISGRSWSAVVVDRHDLRVRSKGIAIEAQRSCFDAARMLFVCCLYAACILLVYCLYAVRMLLVCCLCAACIPRVYCLFTAWLSGCRMQDAL